VRTVPASTSPLPHGQHDPIVDAAEQQRLQVPLRIDPMPWSSSAWAISKPPREVGSTAMKRLPARSASELMSADRRG
jgi:hypothetical protein